MKKTLGIPLGSLAGLMALSALIFTASPAMARVSVDLNIGVPAPVYYVEPPPVYMQARPVYYVQPRPVYVHPRPYYVERHHRHKHYRKHHQRHKHHSHGSHRR